jgi:hypothetical protein
LGISEGKGEKLSKKRGFTPLKHPFLRVAREWGITSA